MYAHAPETHTRMRTNLRRDLPAEVTRMGYRLSARGGRKAGEVGAWRMEYCRQYIAVPYYSTIGL